MSAMSDLDAQAQECGIPTDGRALDEVISDVLDAEWAYEQARYYGLSDGGTWQDVYERVCDRVLREPDPDEAYERQRDEAMWDAVSPSGDGA